MDQAENVVRAFSADHVVRLTGLSHTQLRYWDNTGFFRPRYAYENRRSPFGRVYSFQDVVGLKALGLLRRVYKIPLQQLRKAAHKLSLQRSEPWSTLVLYVFNKEVHFQEPETRQVRSAVTGQYVNIPLRSIIHDVAADAEKLKERGTSQLGKIERHRHIVHNAWVVAGTRIPTKAIWRFHEAGYSQEAIIQEYPTLVRRDVEAALKHEKKQAKRA